MAGKERRHSTTSFSVNVVVAEELSNVTRFIILRSEDGLTSFNKDNSAKFLVNHKYNEAFRGDYFRIIRDKKIQSNLVLVVVLVLESQARVATVREKSEKNENFSRSGKSQRKSLILSKSVICQGILFSGL